MVVGLGHVTLRLHGCHSLKEKRTVVKAVIARVRDKFNVSAADVGANDMHQRAEIGVAAVGNDHSHMNGVMDTIFNFIEAMGMAEVLDTDMEIITL